MSQAFPKANRIPILQLASHDSGRLDDRRLNHVQRYLAAVEWLAGPGWCTAILTAQELAWVWNGKENRDRRVGPFAFV